MFRSEAPVDEVMTTTIARQKGRGTTVLCSGKIDSGQTAGQHQFDIYFICIVCTLTFNFCLYTGFQQSLSRFICHVNHRDNSCSIGIAT